MKKQARCVGCSFCSMWGAVAKLQWCQVCIHTLYDLVASTFDTQDDGGCGLLQCACLLLLSCARLSGRPQRKWGTQMVESCPPV